MCYKVRDANAQSCPECKEIQWNSKTNVCELPASVSATNLKRGLTYSAILGGAVVSVAITVGTAGTGGVTAGTVVIMIVETAGAGIELGAQINIDNKADKFFVDSAKCNSESCAKELVHKYLIELARLGRDLSEPEFEATDKEMARLIGLIPAHSDWWIEYLKDSDGSSFLAKANDGMWTPAQVWRAVGIGMQFAGVASSITGWIIKKTGYLEKTLDRTSKILLSSAKTAEKNIVKVDKLDDVGKEWYKLWQEYAPKNQTLEQFKAMTNGNLDEMKQMTKTWTPRSKRPIINAQIDKQLDDITVEVQRRSTTFENLMDKYNIDAIPADPDELAQLYKQHPDLEQAAKTLDYARAQELKLQEAKVNYNSTNYSTYDPEFRKTFDSQIKSDQIVQARAELNVQSADYQTQIDALQKELDELQQWEVSSGLSAHQRKMELYDQLHDLRTKRIEVLETINKGYDEQNALEASLPTQWDVAEKHQLGNVGNVVKERANQFDEIIKSNPEIQSKLDEKVWAKLSDQERSDVAQKILDEYATKTGTPRANFGLDYNTTAGGYYRPGTNDIFLNPDAQFKTADGMLETLSHEHGHFIDYHTPNEGALGEQYSYYAEKIYNNTEDAGYRVALTEQSSYKIGPGVSHEATGTTHWAHGKEYQLEEAKKVASGEDLDRTVGIFGAAAPAGAGIVVGTEIQVIDAIQNKKD